MPLTKVLQELGKYIEAGRKERKLSQDEFGDIIGCDRRTVQRIENGEGGYSLTILSKALIELNIDVNSIITVQPIIIQTSNLKP